MKFYLDGDLGIPLSAVPAQRIISAGPGLCFSGGMGKRWKTPTARRFLGYPYYSHHDDSVHNDYHNDDCPPMRGVYRWHIMDPIHFGRGFKSDAAADRRLSQGLFERQDDVATVAYWYQAEPHGAFSPLPDREYRWPR